MPDIKPFRGILYNPKSVSVADVVAPPYDVISPAQQSELYDRHPQNIIRLILNRDEDRYASAARLFEQWKRENILITDHESAMYVLSQQFVLPDGTTIDRRGFIVACRLEEIGKGSILPHEKTLSKPKEDRLRLFQSTNAMFSQIFGLYNDRQLKLNAYLDFIARETPCIDVTFEDVRNRLWRLRDERALFAVSNYIKDQSILIADGHHRYETALLYRDACRFQNPEHTGKEPYNFVPMFITNMDDPGLLIFPTHRLLHSVKDFQPRKFLTQLKQYFTVEACQSIEQMTQQLKKSGKHAFGVILPGDQEYSVITLRKDIHLRDISPDPEILLQLDVTVLHLLVFKNVLGITESQQEQKLNLEYEKDPLRAVLSVQEGKAQAAFIMNPTKIEQVGTIAASGMVMPQKSTYFYPKLLSGIVTYSFNTEHPTA